MWINHELTPLESINTVFMLTSEHNNCPLQQSFICHPDLLYFFSCDRQTRSCKDQKSEQRSDPIYSPSVTRLELKFIVNFSKCQKGEESLHTQRRDYKSAASGLQSDYSHGAMGNAVLHYIKLLGLFL